jgi:hypothetical protein
VTTIHAVRSTFSWKILALGIAACLLAPGSASADLATSTSIDVSVHSGSDWGTWSMTIPSPSGPFNWQLSSPLDIYSTTNPGLLLGTIDTMTLAGDSDPFVTLGFNVSAGAAPTVFSINSAVIGFAPIVNGLAFASASINATEGGALLDGATVSGLFAGTKSYEARYNGGTGIFADLVSPVVTAPGAGSSGVSERSPVPIGSRTVIAGAVGDIESQFNFTLSAFDLAAGTSRFDIIVPEPSSIVLAIGGLVAVVVCARRRRA